jgi:hypothetical protein
MELAGELLWELAVLVGPLDVEHVAPIDLLDALATLGLVLVADTSGAASAEYLVALEDCLKREAGA